MVLAITCGYWGFNILVNRHFGLIGSLYELRLLQLFLNSFKDRLVIRPRDLSMISTVDGIGPNLPTLS